MIVGAIGILGTRRWFTLLFTVVGLSMLTLGCGGLDVDGYPEDYRYPQRTSPIITATPTINPSVDSFPKLGALPQVHLSKYASDAEKTVLDVATVSRERAHRLEVALTSIFGTPAKPTLIPFFDVKDGTGDRAGLDQGASTTAVLVKLFGTDDNKLAQFSDKRRVWAKVEREILPNGSKLYRRHCLHCHGVSGNGRGPTAPWVNPHPRDYRQGKFKFTSSLPKQKPLRKDLYRTLYHGLNGTTMPAFKHLTTKEIDEMVSYVIHLSIRGEVERSVLQSLKVAEDALKKAKEEAKKTGKSVDDNIDETGFVKGALDTAVDGWMAAEPIPVAPYEETTVFKEIEAAGNDADGKDAALKASVGRGYKLFNVNACMSCHVNYGRSDRYLLDSWGTMVRPRNLVQGTLRGGSRPIDVYYRITAGIDPAGMPGEYKTKKEVRGFVSPTAIWNPHGMEGESLSPDNVWDLVNFVRALPYPHMLPPDVKKAIYGTR